MNVYSVYEHFSVASRCIPNPCHNGGTCEEGGEVYTCHCPASYRGYKCEGTTVHGSAVTQGARARGLLFKNGNTPTKLTILGIDNNNNNNNNRLFKSTTSSYKLNYFR